MYSRKNEKKSLFRNYKKALAGLVALATALAIGLTLSGCAAEQPAARNGNVRRKNAVRPVNFCNILNNSVKP